MHFLQTEYTHTIRNKCIKSIIHEMNNTRRPRVSGELPGCYEIEGFIYQCDGAYFERCSALTINDYATSRQACYYKDT